MNIVGIRLANFLSHRNTTVNLRGHNPIIVVGKNGSGKSSLFKDSITWGLFGKARGSGDELITEGQGACEVEIGFAIGNIDYKVMRKRVRNSKSELHLSRMYKSEWQDESGAVIAETQEKIDRLLGMTCDVFTNTACVEQGKSDSFSALSPKSAKQILSQIMRLEVYNVYLSRTRKILVELSGKMIKVRAEISALEVYESKDTLGKFQSETFEQWKEDIQTELGVLVDKMSENDQKIGAIADDLMAKNVRLSELVLYSRQLTDAITNVRQKGVLIGGGKCPVCFSELSGERLGQVIHTYENKIEKYESEKSKTDKEIHGLQSSVKGLIVDRNSCDEFRILTQDRIDKLKADLENVRITEACRVADEARRSESLQKMQIARDEAHRLAGLISRYEILEKAFDQHGIPSMIIDNVMPELELSANSALETLAAGNMKVQIRTQKQLKTGGIGDALDIVVLHGNVVRLYENLSGGEKFRIDLALRVALSKVLSRRTGYNISTMIIDEGMGCLDEEGKDQFVALMTNLKLFFERIIVITHIDIKDRIGTELRVEKRDRESVVSIG